MPSLFRHMLWPWWAIQLATGAKSFIDNPLIGSRRLNEAGLHVARVKLAYSLSSSRRKRLAHLIDPADQAAFDHDGFIFKTDFLPPEQFAQLRDQVAQFRGPAREMIQGDAVTRRLALDRRALNAMPAVRALLKEPRWRGLIRYVGASDSEPLTYIQTILAHAVEGGAPDPQLELHADTFHPTVKAWLFLTDVAEEDGPFTYVPGSHRLTPERLAWERKKSLDARSAERLTARGSFRVARDGLEGLGLPQPRSFPVPANTLIIADTFGFHARGAAARPSARVEIWGYGRRNPFLPWTGLDPLSVSGISEKRVNTFWALHDRLEPWIGQPWKFVGNKTAFEA